MPTFQGLLLVYPASWLAAGAAVTVAYWALEAKAADFWKTAPGSGGALTKRPGTQQRGVLAHRIPNSRRRSMLQMLSPPERM